MTALQHFVLASMFFAWSCFWLRFEMTRHYEEMTFLGVFGGQIAVLVGFIWFFASLIHFIGPIEVWKP